MGPHEPYWRTNTSFSPRFDIMHHSDGQSIGSQDGSQMYGSSTSSNSQETGSWLRGNYIPNHQHSVSDGVGPYISSPSDFSPAQQLTNPTIQENGVDEFGNSSTRVLGITFSAPQDSRVSVSSLSDNTDNEQIPKSQSSYKNLTTRRCFISKPVHPLTFPPKENGPACPHPRFSTPSSDLDLTDVSEPVEVNPLTRPSVNQSHVYNCGLCERFLSQRSPFSSRRIVKTGDFPVTGVLPCRHVFHAECLDQTTPKARKTDPLCPLCAESDEEIASPEQRVFSMLKNGNGFPKLFREDGPSKNTMLINRNRVKKTLSLKSNSSKKNWSIGSPDPSANGSSKTASSSDKKS